MPYRALFQISNFKFLMSVARRLGSLLVGSRRLRRWKLHQPAAFRFVNLRPNGANDLESFAFQQICRAARSVRVIGDGYDRPVLRDFGEMLFKFRSLDAEVHRK